MHSGEIGVSPPLAPGTIRHNTGTEGWSQRCNFGWGYQGDRRQGAILTCLSPQWQQGLRKKLALLVPVLVPERRGSMEKEPEGGGWALGRDDCLNQRVDGREDPQRQQERLVGGYHLGGCSGCQDHQP